MKPAVYTPPKVYKVRMFTSYQAFLSIVDNNQNLRVQFWYSIYEIALCCQQSQ